MTNPYAPPTATVDDVSVRTPCRRAGGTPHAVRRQQSSTRLIFGCDGVSAAGHWRHHDANRARAIPGQIVGPGVAMLGFLVWAAVTLRYMSQNGQSIGEEDRWDQGRAREVAGLPGRMFWLRNIVNGRARVRPAVCVRGRPGHLRRDAAVSARQDRGHDCRQGLTAAETARACSTRSLAAETPEGILLELRPAGLERAFLRVPDRLADSHRHHLRGALRRGRSWAASAIALWLILVFALEWFYPVAFELTPRGATPGKRAFGLKVVMDNGLPVTPAASVTRNLLRVADFLPFGFGFAIVSMCAARLQAARRPRRRRRSWCTSRGRRPRRRLDMVAPVRRRGRCRQRTSRR